MIKETGDWKPTVAQLKQLIVNHRAMKSHPDNEDTLELAIFVWALNALDEAIAKKMTRKLLDHLFKENARLKEALGEIGGMGCSQPAALNMPEVDWNFRLFSHCQRIAREALKEAA